MHLQQTDVVIGNLSTHLDPAVHVAENLAALASGCFTPRKLQGMKCLVLFCQHKLLLHPRYSEAYLRIIAELEKHPVCRVQKKVTLERCRVTETNALKNCVAESDISHTGSWEPATKIDTRGFMNEWFVISTSFSVGFGKRISSKESKRTILLVDAR
eukprot:Seg2910.2 transcript_id=Seg2910.2/GoldUCD/mRNA.D3Y31 product="hypothetical protein" protein_id=Seg2910.2/GoldUCD/D3Y31